MFNYPGKTRMRFDLLFLMKKFRVTKVAQPVKTLAAKACMTNTFPGLSISLSPKGFKGALAFVFLFETGSHLAQAVLLHSVLRTPSASAPSVCTSHV